MIIWSDDRGEASHVSHLWYRHHCHDPDVAHFASESSFWSGFLFFSSLIIFSIFVSQRNSWRSRFLEAEESKKPTTILMLL